MGKFNLIDRSHRTIHPRLRTPLGMSRMEISEEQAKIVHKISMGVFTDMSNRGYSISEAIVAVYLSGVNHGVELSDE